MLIQKAKLLLSLAIVLAGANAQGAGDTISQTVLVDESELVQDLKDTRIETSIAELGAITVLSNPNGNKVNLVAFYQVALSPVLQQMKDEMQSLGGDVSLIQLNNPERHSTVLGYTSNLAEVSPEENARIRARADEIRALRSETPITIDLAYRLTRNTRAVQVRQNIVCSKQILANFEFQLHEPTGALQNVSFKTVGAYAERAKIDEVVVAVNGDPAAATQECLAQLK